MMANLTVKDNYGLKMLGPYSIEGSKSNANNKKELNAFIDKLLEYAKSNGFIIGDNGKILNSFQKEVGYISRDESRKTVRVIIKDEKLIKYIIQNLDDLSCYKTYRENDPYISYIFGYK